MNPIQLDARDLPDAWFQTLFKLLEVGKVFVIDRGSFEGHKRLEFDYITIHIKYPSVRPLIPYVSPHFGISPPTTIEYVEEQYLPYLMTGKLAEGESYTYGQRLTRYPIDYLMYPEKYSNKQKEVMIDEIEQFKELGIIFFDKEFDKWCLNQIELVNWVYKNKGYRNNQMVLQVGHPTDMLLKDPPCLRQIDTRIQDGKLNFVVYFRSWDLFNGFPSNLAGIQILKEYIASCIGVEDGEMIVSSKGLHLYDYSVDFAKCLRMKDGLGW